MPHDKCGKLCWAAAAARTAMADVGSGGGDATGLAALPSARAGRPAHGRSEGSPRCSRAAAAHQ